MSAELGGDELLRVTLVAEQCSGSAPAPPAAPAGAPIPPRRHCAGPCRTVADCGGVTDFYLLDEKLTDEERAIRDRLREFCDAEVTPVINGYWERAEFPFELVPEDRRRCRWRAGRSRATAARA